MTVFSPAPPRLTLEACAGCGARALIHPMVGVVNTAWLGNRPLVTAPPWWRDEHDKPVFDMTREFTAIPICLGCWTNPGHRRVTLKAHFFPRAQARVAVAMAGAATLGG